MPATPAITLLATAAVVVLPLTAEARDRGSDRGTPAAAARGDRLATERFDATGEPDAVAIAVDEDARRRLLDRRLPAVP